MYTTSIPSRELIVQSRLSDELRNKISNRLDAEPSDTVLSKEFGVSRKTIWRLRQAQRSPSNPVTPQTQAPKVVKVSKPQEISVAPTPKKKPPRVMPKVDSVKVVMGMYFAVQLLRNENYVHVSKAVLDQAQTKKVLFRKLQVLDIVSVGMTAFVRFRADLTKSELDTIMQGLDRCTILPGTDGYKVTLPNGRSGKYPASSMCTDAKMGFGHIYAGTRIERWRHQFNK